MYDGDIVAKVGTGGSLWKLQGEVYDAVGVRLVKKDTTTGWRDGVETDSSNATPPSPCDADNAGAASFFFPEGIYGAMMGNSRHNIRAQVVQKRKTREE